MPTCQGRARISALGQSRLRATPRAGWAERGCRKTMAPTHIALLCKERKEKQEKTQVSFKTWIDFKDSAWISKADVKKVLEISDIEAINPKTFHWRARWKDQQDKAVLERQVYLVKNTQGVRPQGNGENIIEIRSSCEISWGMLFSCRWQKVNWWCHYTQWRGYDLRLPNTVKKEETKLPFREDSLSQQENRRTSDRCEFNDHIFCGVQLILKIVFFPRRRRN